MYRSEHRARVGLWKTRADGTRPRLENLRKHAAASRFLRRRHCRRDRATRFGKPIPSDRRPAHRISFSGIASVDISRRSLAAIWSVDVERLPSAYGFLSKPVCRCCIQEDAAAPRAREKGTRDGDQAVESPAVLKGTRQAPRVNAWADIQGDDSRPRVARLSGIARIARRENGIRVYHPSASTTKFPALHRCVSRHGVRRSSRPADRFCVGHCAPRELGSTRAI